MLTTLAHLFVLGSTPAIAPAESYEIDPVHSTLIFKVTHLNTTPFRGRFNQVEGTVVFDRDNPAKSTVEVIVTAESVDSNAAGRDRHLKSPDFLDVAQFPTIEFKSTKVTAKGKDAFEVTGDLKLHGVTKSITVNVTKTGEGEMRGTPIIGFETVFTVKRSDHGMTFMLEGLGDEVEMALGIEARRGR